MEISVFGSGYAGLVTAACLSKLGNKVICVDIDEKKVDLINSGKSPIYETGLNEIISESRKKNLISATLDFKDAVKNSDISFICVGTPSNEDGSIDLKYVKSAAKNIGLGIKEKDSYHLIVTKSTVVPLTTEKVVLPIIEEYSGKKAGVDFGIGVNPEFLREGSAVKDFLNPDKIIIGGIDEKSRKILKDLYSIFNCNYLITSPRTAEMVKYANNAFLASKVSFINEIANICQRLGIDVNKVAEGIGFDKRISPYFLRAGAGWGGSCWEKDVKAIISKAKEAGYNPVLLESAIRVNDLQPSEVVNLATGFIKDFNGIKAGILGLAFKPETDDVRGSRSFVVINELLKKGADITVYDPKANEITRKIYAEKIKYAKNAEEVCENSDIIFVLTAWDEFKTVLNYDKPIIFGRRLIEPEELKNKKFKLIGYGGK